jgi:LmbE family N-acetylglucosaminyl deacetylase
MTARRVLVVAAHPDDEVLGCGGAMARHAADGDEVHVVLVAEGATSRHVRRDADGHDDELEALRAAAAAAAARLGARPPVFLGLPDNRLDEVPFLDLVKAIEGAIGAVAPDVVYTHHGGDLNQDHRLVQAAVLTALRPQPGTKPTAVYAFEVLSSSEWAAPAAHAAFLPQRFVNITGQLAAKLAAMACYRSELRDFPHPRSLPGVETLARLRGTTCGFAAAEAFMVLREVIA